MSEREAPEETPSSSTPIFDAMADRGILDPEILESETSGLDDATEAEPAEPIPVAAAPAPAEPDIESTAEVPPDAAARDAARRESAGPVDEVLHGAEFRFITRGVSDEERAAVIAVLTQVRADETKRVRRVERREHQPWARSQRVPEGIGDLLAEG